MRCTDATKLRIVRKTVGECGSLWEDGVLLGVVSKKQFLQPKCAKLDEGIACNPFRRITEEDRVIFLAEHTFPKLAGPVPDTPDLAKLVRRNHTQHDVLVCGPQGHLLKHFLLTLEA